jgi:outer membrane protein OmpA-like peptidoglycan-associated protein
MYGSTGELIDPDLLENNTSLRHIDITQSECDMADSLQAFGNLRHLMALQTVSLRFDGPFDGDDYQMTDRGWADLDEVLAQARDTLKEVEIYAHTDRAGRIPPKLALLRGWLPSVAQKISVYPTREEGMGWQ